MSELEEDFPSTTSEDFGFKLLGSPIQVVDDYNEDLPYKHISNFAYASHKGFFVAAGKDDLVLGSLESLKKDIVEGKDTYESDAHRLAIPGINSVTFTSDEKLLLVSAGSKLLFQQVTGDYKDVSSAFQELAFSADIEVVSSNPCYASTVLVLLTDGQLQKADLVSNTQSTLAQDVLDFSWHHELDKIAIAKKDRTISLQSLGGSSQTDIELPEEIDAEYYPLSVAWIDETSLFAVVGEPAEKNDEEEPSTDFKHFVIEIQGTQFNFRETYDAVPAYGTVWRRPTIYLSQIHSLSESLPCLTLLGSSMSTDISAVTSHELLAPADDSERATLPINEETSNDVNPIGLTIDLRLKDTITDPCPGVPEATWLPSVWVLGSDGKVQSWYIFHAHDLKTGSFKPDLAIQYEDRIWNKAQGTTDSGIQMSDSAQNPVHEKSPNISSNTEFKSLFGSSATSPANVFAKGDMQNESKPAFGSSGFGANTDGKPAFGSSGFGTSTDSKPAFGSSGFGTTADSKPAFGSSGFGTTADSKPAFGSSGFGTTTDSKPAFGSSGFGTTADSKPAFGSSGFGTATDSKSPFSTLNAEKDKDNKASLGSSGFGTTADSKPAFGSSGFGTSTDSKSPFSTLNAEKDKDNKASLGSSGFGTTADSKPAFGSSGFGTTTDSKPAFGSSGFGTTADSKPAFGSSGFGTTTDSKPAFGSSGFGTTADSKPTFGSSGFGTATDSKSPFSTLNAGKDKDNKTSFGSSGFNTENKFSFGSTAGSSQPAFGSSGFGSSIQSGSVFGDNRSAGSGSTVKPVFANTSQEADTKRESPFSQLSSSKTNSLFGSAGSNESPFARLSGSNDKEPTKTKSQSPFSSLKPESDSFFGSSQSAQSSPFDSLGNTGVSPLFSNAQPSHSATDKDKVFDFGSVSEAVKDSKETGVSALDVSSSEEEIEDDSDSDSDEVENQVSNIALTDLNPLASSSGPTNFGNAGLSFNGNAGSFGSTGFGTSGFTFGDKPKETTSSATSDTKFDFSNSGFGAFADKKLNFGGKNIFESSDSGSEQVHESHDEQSFHGFDDHEDTDEKTQHNFSDDIDGVQSISEDDVDAVNDSSSNIEDNNGEEEGSSANESELTDNDSDNQNNEESAHASVTAARSDAYLSSDIVHVESDADEEALIKNINDDFEVKDDVEDAEASDLSDITQDMSQQDEVEESEEVPDDSETQKRSNIEKKDDDVSIEPDQVSRHNKATQPDMNYVSESIQTDDNTIEAEVQATVQEKHISIQTDPIELVDVSQDLCDDEVYFGSFHLPIDIKSYIHVKDVKYPKLSSNNLEKEIELMFYDTEAELMVVEENIRNLNNFFLDHCNIPVQHTEVSIGHSNQWRLSEAYIINDILNSTVKQSSTIASDTNSDFVTVDEVRSGTKVIEDRCHRVANKLVALEKQYDVQLNASRELDFEQLMLQQRVRESFANTSSQLRYAETKLLTLKSIANVFYDKNPTPKVLGDVICQMGVVSSNYSTDVQSLTDEIAKMNLNHSKILGELQKGKSKLFDQHQHEDRSMLKIKIDDSDRKFSSYQSIIPSLKERTVDDVTNVF